MKGGGGECPGCTESIYPSMRKTLHIVGPEQRIVIGYKGGYDLVHWPFRCDKGSRWKKFWCTFPRRNLHEAV